MSRPLAPSQAPPAPTPPHTAKRRRAAWRAGLLLLLVLASLAAVLAWRAVRQQRALAARVQAVQPPRDLPAVPCKAQGEPARVLLVLGQSNAGNHGGQGEMPAAAPLRVFTGAGCQWAVDPLPGGTGRHGSVWSRLPGALAREGDPRPLVLALLAVDGTPIADWTNPRGALVHRLDELLAQLAAAGLQPDAVLWQQGEADAQAGTSTADYLARFGELRARLRAAGVAAPIFVAGSTVCRDADTTAVRAARAEMPAKWPDVHLGADTDSLQGPMRVAQCHLSGLGLYEAAALWARTLVGTGSPARP